MRACSLLLMLMVGVWPGHCLALTRVKVVSPDAKIEFVLERDASGRLQHRVACDGRPVLLPAPLGLTLDGADLGSSATLGRAIFQKVEQRFTVLGGHATAASHCREARVPLISGPQKTAWAVEVRACDDGVAFRYRVPGSGVRHIAGEVTTWRLPAGGAAWYQVHNKRKDYEAPFQTSAVSEIPDRLRAPASAVVTPPVSEVTPSANTRGQLATPLTIKSAGGLYTLLTEASLIGYSDMALKADGDDTFSAYFHNQPQGWDWTGEIVSPWRATLIARDLNALVNSDFLRSLSPPAAPELAAADWIRPGRASWHWMVTGRPKLADQKQWIDWTKALGFEYYIIDDGWTRWTSDDNQKDAWACLKDVVEYAASQNVKIWAWVNAKELPDTPARLAYMSRAQSLGVVGLKIDFMKPADVAWVQWYDDTLRDAASQRLMIDFHGALKPSGRERTWPNELTREAVRGREGGKQAGLHDATLPFTRYVQGPADYTPTDFRSEKLKGSSWAHELSMAIVFTSPLLCYGGSPETYLQNDALEILKAIPATWDETVVLPGSEIGVLAAFARRKGDTWFVGVLNGGAERTFKVDLAFLGSGSYRIEDFADSKEQPDAWKPGQSTATARDKYAVDLRNDGGYVARLTRSKR
jgi:alpha-glucosidase